MSQVISIKVPCQYEEACAEFQKELFNSSCTSNDDSAEQDFIITYDESAHEIQCEGNISDLVFSALMLIKDRFDGELFYERKKWREKDDENVEEAGSMEKAWIVLANIFFPLTLLFLFIRAVVWVPYRIWKAIRRMARHSQFMPPILYIGII